MTDAGDAFRLPEGMQSAGDPIEGNPFPETARRNQVWSDATHKAEEELCRFNARLLTERPAPEAENYADWMIALIVGKFDIWAKRGVHVVWSDNEVRAYDQWLFNYAQEWLESARSFPILGQTESLLNELRLRLMERMEFWKAEGRRYVTDQKALQKSKLEAVDAGWLRIQSKRLGGATLSNCLKEAYDHHAGLFAQAGEPLTETVLNLTIPALVFSGAIHYKWVPYPLVRPDSGRVVDFLESGYEHPHSHYELVPDEELTETLGGYKVTSDYEGQFRRILESRIAHWRGEGSMRALAGASQKSEPAGDTGQQAGSSAPPQAATVKDGTIGAEYTAASWQTIEISFLSDERVQIRCGPQIETRNYSELVGFADRRNGKPNQAWVMLRAMAEAKGLIRDAANAARDWPRVEKRMQEIRKALREHFAISVDPVPYIEGAGYQARFKIGCGPSFHT
jgi:hypothetical protein